MLLLFIWEACLCSPLTHILNFNFRGPCLLAISCQNISHLKHKQISLSVCCFFKQKQVVVMEWKTNTTNIYLSHLLILETRCWLNPWWMVQPKSRTLTTCKNPFSISACPAQGWQLTWTWILTLGAQGIIQGAPWMGFLSITNSHTQAHSHCNLPKHITELWEEAKAGSWDKNNRRTWDAHRDTAQRWDLNLRICCWAALPPCLNTHISWRVHVTRGEHPNSTDRAGNGIQILHPVDASLHTVLSTKLPL